MPVFNASDLTADVKARMIAFSDVYLQLRKTVQRAHIQGAVFGAGDAQLDAVRDLVVDFEALMCDNGAGSARTPADRAAILDDYGVVDILA